MELIPLVYVKNRKITIEKEGNPLSLTEVLEQVDRDKSIYFLDIDGIEKDKPNLCTYQRIPEKQKIWIDAGPRVLGDVVDAIMAGATTITIRQNLWPKLDIPSIREITENEIYLDLDLKSQGGKNIHVSLSNGTDGLVIFTNKNQIEKDFKSSGFLKSLSTKYKIYAYDPNPKNFSYWEKHGVAGLLVDLDKVEEIKKYGL